MLMYQSLNMSCQHEIWKVFANISTGGFCVSHEFAQHVLCMCIMLNDCCLQVNIIMLTLELAHMQFLAARSRCTNFCSARYSIPLATCRHMPTSLFVMSDTWTNIVGDKIMLCKQTYKNRHCVHPHLRNEPKA